MQQENILTGKTEEEVWQQIDQQFGGEPEILEYTAIIEQDEKRIMLDIDIDLGGGFESGYATTTFSAMLPPSPGFTFGIHHEHFIDEIGKFFGMEDVETGYSEFDKKLVVKTNDRERVRAVFADEQVRSVFQTLDDFTFAIARHHSNGEPDVPFLELQIEVGITDPLKLREIYHAFLSVLIGINKPHIA